jgi:D-alanine-D-alanine ligase
MKAAVLYNVDYDEGEDDYAARADVEKTAHAVASAIESKKGDEAVLVPVVGRTFDFVEKLRSFEPNVVFNLCESLAGEAENEALIPALLDFLRIPYTGSSVLTLCTALRKDRTKELLVARAVPTPRAHVFGAKMSLTLPVIVKPNSEDGSLGIHRGSVVSTLPALRKQAKALLSAYGGTVLLEEFVSGREIIVPLLERKASSGEFEPLPLSEIDFSHMPEHLPKIVTYAAKWEEGTDEYRGSTTRLNPALKPALRKKVMAAAQAAFFALDCRGYARVDMRVSESGEPYVIDVNPNCDLSTSGGFFRACKAAGMTYADMVAKIIALA